MPRPVRLINILVVIVKALLITAAILFLGQYFGLNVREAGGHAVAGTLGASANSPG